MPDPRPDWLCTRCMTWHEPPKCDHKPDAACRDCGRALGFLGNGQPRDGACNRCWLAAEFGIRVGECVAPAVVRVDPFGDVV